MGQLFPGSFNAFRPVGFEAITLSTSSTSTLTVPAGATGVLVQATGGKVNWRDDGVAPTNVAGGGMVIAADAEPSWFNGDLSVIEFIAQGASTFLLASFYN